MLIYRWTSEANSSEIMDLCLQFAICHAQKCAEVSSSTEENTEVSVGNWRLFISGRSSIITNVRACGATSDRYTEDQRQRRVNCFRNRKLIFSSLSFFAIFFSFSSQHWFTVFPTTSQEELFFRSLQLQYFMRTLCVWGSCWMLWQQIEIYEEFSGEMKMRENFPPPQWGFSIFHSTRTESRRLSAWSQQPQTVSRFFLSFSITRVLNTIVRSVFSI